MSSIRWRKSSHCTPSLDCDAGNCVEAASWRKSTRSGHNGNCVEAGHGPGVVGVRDSQLKGGSPVLEFTPAAWTAFTARLKAA